MLISEKAREGLHDSKLFSPPVNDDRGNGLSEQLLDLGQTSTRFS